MQNSYFKVVWDISRQTMNVNAWGKVGDTARGFEVELIQGGSSLPLDSRELRLKWEKPDMTKGYVTATREGNKFIFSGISQMFTVEGSVKAEFELQSGVDFLYSPSFYPVVESSIGESPESENKLSALQEAIYRVQQLEISAVENEAGRAASETARQEAEGGRVAAEGQRSAAEVQRALDESERVLSEQTRSQAEQSRLTAEQDRADTESGRGTAEATRVSSEALRGLAETDRVNVESSRVTAEEGRVAAEQTRVSNEDLREIAETERETSELNRQQKEAARELAETAREQSEENRALSEQERIQQEGIRQSQEEEREVNTSTALDEMDFAYRSTIVIWKQSVASFPDLELTYPSPELGWRVEIEDEGTVYRYDGTGWIRIANTSNVLDVEKLSNKGMADGYAPLDQEAMIPHEHLANFINVGLTQPSSGWWLQEIQ